MRKVLLALIFSCSLLSTRAQEYLSVGTFWDGTDLIPVELIDSITFGEISGDLLPELMAKDDNIKLFYEALQITGLCDSLMDVYDKCYFYDKSVAGGIYASSTSPILQKLRKGYTAFVETDAVYAQHGIYTIEDLKDYAAKVYDDMYPEDAAVSDPTNRRNSLNRFVAYHLLDRKATKSNLTAAGITNELAGNVYAKYVFRAIDVADWYETMMPHSLMKCSYPAGFGTVFVNRRGLNDHADDRGVLIEGANITNVAAYDCQGEALNGYYHYIDDIIAYDRQTQEVVLDEQILVNNSTISPEFMNNEMRIYNPFPKLNSDNAVLLPKGALKNVQINNDDTRMFYLLNDVWNNVQTDEFLFMGDVDFTIKLPSLPAGTYELNLGYSASAFRHVVDCYFDGEYLKTIDFRKTADNPDVGWVSDRDLETPEAIAANDRELFDNGYRKGLAYCRGANYTTLRECSYCLRRIITTFTTDGKTDHYLRFKNALETDYDAVQFMIDYLELCPTHILPEYQ